MVLDSLAIVFGLALLVWSADRFVAGSVLIAHCFGMPPLLIGMVIVGFGTSAPEMVVSIISATQGKAGIAHTYWYNRPACMSTLGWRTHPYRCTGFVGCFWQLDGMDPLAGSTDKA